MHECSYNVSDDNSNAGHCNGKAEHKGDGIEVSTIVGIKECDDNNK